MQEIFSSSPEGLSVTIGAEPVDLNVAGVYVHNGLEEIKSYVKNEAKAELQEVIRQAGCDFEAEILAYDDNAYMRTEQFNLNALEQKNYITEEALYWTNAPLEENPEGSAKYWAEQAKINYQEALDLTDSINNEEV